MSRSERYVLPHDMFLHEALEEMVSQGMIAESEMNSALSRTNRYTQMQKDSTVTVECDTDRRPINKAKEEKMRQDRAVEALTKQYAPDTFTDLVSAAMFVHLKAGV